MQMKSFILIFTLFNLASFSVMAQQENHADHQQEEHISTQLIWKS